MFKSFFRLTKFETHKLSISKSGFYSKQLCCYYCRACQWVCAGDDAGMTQHLYTNFGKQAAHRNTFLVELVYSNSLFFRPINLAKSVCFQCFHLGCHHPWTPKGWLLLKSGWTYPNNHRCAQFPDGHHGVTWCDITSMD